MKLFGRLVFAALVIGLLVAANEWGFFALLRDPARFGQALLGTGSIGVVGFILLYTVLQPYGVPGTLFLIVAPLIWSWPIAYLASMAGTMGASLVGFFSARYLARDFIRARIPERFLSYEAPLERRPFWTVFWLRLVFWMPQALHAFLGVSRVSARDHLWGSLLGYALPLFLTAYFGEAFFELLRGIPVWGWIAFGIATLLGLVYWFLASRRTLVSDGAEPIRRS